MRELRDFPDIKPSSRSYTPGTFPQTEFVAQNGAKTVIRYGNKKTDAKLTLGFTNITDEGFVQLSATHQPLNADGKLSILDYDSDIFFDTRELD